MTLWTGSFTTPIGLVGVVVDGEGAVKRFHFGQFDVRDSRPDAKAIKLVRDQVEEYFASDRRAFELPLAPEGTIFQREVWDGLLTIPFGQTLSYGELAARIGRPDTSRAVGAANGANPIGLIIPCHRVVGQDRRLTGFGGGIPIKAALLAHEGVLAHELVPMAVARTRIEAATLL
jgi:methylated-DNA-[protein]-cysteine S-methyltransferase